MQGNVLKVKNDLCEINFDYLNVNGKPSVNCHIDIFKWTKSTKKEILDTIDKVAQEEPLDKYVVWDGIDNKFLKFITMCGFNYTGCYTEAFGQKEYMFIWSNI
jgi:hypothetical protein